MEGGSWDRIEDWTLCRAEAMQGYWRRHGPPLHIVAQEIGAKLGIDWKLDAATPDHAEPSIWSGPSIAELAMSAVPL